MKASEILAGERAALCDTFERYGPDAPTLCEGWTTADLAAHLVVRERRLDAGPGIILGGPFARHTTSLMEKAKAKGYDTMIDRLRNGPPFPMNAGPGAKVNVSENWVHHEDVRRANGESPRPLDPDVDELLWSVLGFGARMGMRKVPVGVGAVTPDGRRRTLRRGGPVVTISGDAPEIVLFTSGRRDAADVTLEGPDDAVEVLRTTQFGL